MNQVFYFPAYGIDRVPQNDPGAHFLGVVVNQKAGDPQSSHRYAAFGVQVGQVVIHVPVHIQVRNDIHLGVVQVCDYRQHNAGSVCLHPVLQDFFQIIQKIFHRDFFIGVLAANVNPHQGYKADLRMVFQGSPDLSDGVFVFWDSKQHLIKF